MAVVTQTDCPKSVRNRCVIEVFGGVFVLSIGFRIFCWYRGFCHRIETDLFRSPLKPLDRSRSVRNRCVIELICTVLCYIDFALSVVNGCLSYNCVRSLQFSPRI